MHRPKLDLKCLQTKHIYPGESHWKLIYKIVPEFFKDRDMLLAGGFAMHFYLQSVHPELSLYDTDDVCAMSDFDVMSKNPVADLTDLADELHSATHVLFSVGTGARANQYYMQLEYIAGSRFIDCVFASSNIYDFLPKFTTASGIKCLDPKIELLQQYSMLAAVLFLPADKDLAKVAKRIELIERTALEPWLQQTGLDTIHRRVFDVADTERHDESLKQLICNWSRNQSFVVPVGSAAYINKYAHRKVPMYSLKFLEFAIHDMAFQDAIRVLFDELRQTAHATHITIERHDAFLGNIGPLYNGWLSIFRDQHLLCTIYSLAYPVHMYDVQERICSFFHNMSHCMWRGLYAGFINNVVEQKFFYELVARQYMRYLLDKKDDYFVFETKVLGIVPMRNVYMLNNMRRKTSRPFKYVSGSTHTQIRSEGIAYEGKLLYTTDLQDARDHNIESLFDSDNCTMHLNKKDIHRNKKKHKKHKRRKQQK